MRIINRLDLSLISKQRSDLFEMLYPYFKEAMCEYLRDDYDSDDKYIERIFITIYRYILPETDMQVIDDVIELCKAPVVSSEPQEVVN